MGRGISKKKKAMQAEIAELEIKKRNGMLRAVVAFAALAFVIWIKLMFQTEIEWLNSTVANMTIFVLALVAAGVAGLGTRAWQQARVRIQELQKRL